MKLSLLTYVILLLLLPNCSSTETAQLSAERDCSFSEREIFQARNFILNDLSLDTIDSGAFESYTVVKHFALGGQSVVKFYQDNSGYNITYKKSRLNDTLRDSYSNYMHEEDWKMMLYIIDEFDFWNEPICRSMSSTDGYYFIIHGTKPFNTFGLKGHSKSVFRSNLMFDKMVTLGYSLFEHEEELYFKNPRGLKQRHYIDVPAEE